MNIPPLLKINFVALVYLSLAIYFVYNAFLENPTKDALKKFKSKRAKKVTIFLMRILFIFMLLLCIFSINIPILRDTFSQEKPLILTGKVNFVSKGLFGSMTYRIRQSFDINDVSLHIFFYPDIIIEGKTYKVTYLRHSRSVLTIERLD